MARVLHILSQGSPLCGFMRGVPSEWPEGHVWVSAFDPHQVKLADCLPCRRAFELAGAASKTRKTADKE